MNTASWMERIKGFSAENDMTEKVRQIPEGTHTGTLTNMFFRKQDPKKAEHPTIDITICTVENGVVTGRISNNFDMLDQTGNIRWKDIAMIMNAVDGMIDGERVNDASVEDICSMSTLKCDQYLTADNVFGYGPEECDLINGLMDFCSGLNALSKADITASPKVDFIVKAGDTLTTDGERRNNLQLRGYRNSDGIRTAGTFKAKEAKAETIREAYRLKDIALRSKTSADLARKVKEALKE